MGVRADRGFGKASKQQRVTRKGKRMRSDRRPGQVPDAVDFCHLLRGHLICIAVPSGTCLPHMRSIL